MTDSASGAADLVTGADFIVVGAGIAGASLAYFLAPHGRTIVLERESQPGYHSTGRSAALYIPSYGTPQVRALTAASRPFLMNPPPGFTENAILTPREVLTIALPGQQALLDEAWDVASGVSRQARRIDTDAACAIVPVLKAPRIGGAILEPESYDVDVHALHQGYLRGIRRHGGLLVGDAEVSAVQRAGRLWRVRAGGRLYEAPVLVDAAGAWCDVVAQRAGVRPLGLVPKRRSAFTFRGPHGVDCAHWPLVIAVDSSFYFKPDAGVLLGSPCNEDATEPQDVQPEEYDIALAMHLIEENTTLAPKPLRTWAGLRSFVADGDLVGGWADDVPGFFWCAAQGGYGIQTSAAMGQACAALVLGRPLPPHIAITGLDAAQLSPARLLAAPALP